MEMDKSLCALSCEMSADCPSGHLCLGGACGLVKTASCDNIAEIEIESSSRELRARIGGLFGDQYYQPQWFASEPQDWVEPYNPSYLTVRVKDADGAPVEGCEILLSTEESSGYAFSEESASDAKGELAFLWVAGGAPQQSVRAGVRDAEGEWHFASIEGEARPHDEAPFVIGPEGRTSTAPSGITVAPDASETTNDVRVEFTFLTFPARVTYSVFETEGLAVDYSNESSVAPRDDSVPEADRLVSFRIPTQQGVAGQVVAIRSTGFCYFEGELLSCQFADAWLPGESISVRVQARELAFGEVPNDYDLATHSQSSCTGANGCTDYSIFTTRAGESEQRQAVVRSPFVDDFSMQQFSIGGVYTPELGIAANCLLTERASLLLSWEALVHEIWTPSTRASTWSAHASWQNQICSNYAVLLGPEGYYLSTGGASVVSTPSLPGTKQLLELR